MDTRKIMLIVGALVIAIGAAFGVNQMMRGAAAPQARAAAAPEITGPMILVATRQLPVGTISLKLKSGPRAPLATPATCGAGRITGQLSSWAGQEITLENPTSTVCAAGLGGFAPTFVAGTDDPIAGACGSVFNIVNEKRLNHRIPVVKGVLGERCGEVLRSFFRSRRQASK